MASNAPKPSSEFRPAPAPQPVPLASPRAVAPRIAPSDGRRATSNAVATRALASAGQVGLAPPIGIPHSNAEQVRVVTKGASLAPGKAPGKSDAKSPDNGAKTPAAGGPRKGAGAGPVAKSGPGETAKPAEPAGHGEAAAKKAGPEAGKTAPRKRGAPGAADGEGAAAESAPAHGERVAGPELLMPEPPAGPSPAAQKRMGQVQAGVAKTSTAHANLPDADTQVSQARTAVTPPTEQADAEASAALVALLDDPDIAPSPEIEKLCVRIYEVIRDKRPADEDKLVDADPQEIAQAAGKELDQSVQSDTTRVAGGYDDLQGQPKGKTPTPGKDPEAPPATVDGPDQNAAAAAPDAVPPQNVSLKPDVAANEQRMTDAGMNKPSAKEAKTGPIADARAAQGDLEGLAESGPAEALAEQQTALASARADLAGLQKSALKALQASRSTTISDNRNQHTGMVGSEEQMRKSVSKEARGIFEAAQKEVRDKLKPLPVDAMKVWEAGVKGLSLTFKAHLHKVESWIKERHSGLGGAVVSLWDSATGLPGWVTDEYDVAEKNFGDGVCALVRDISKQVNIVVAACEKIIANADKRIADLFSSLPTDLQDWANGEQAKFHEQLDGLRNEARQTRDNFTHDLVKRAGEAVQDVRQQIQKLRQEAKGLLERAADAIQRFLDDPIRAIIDALLDLVGIPPADFWALVEQIKHVISDIADDPGGFTTNLLNAVGQGFSQFFDNIGEHLLKGMLDWLLSGLKDVGVELPKDLSLKSIITFFLQLMGITWPRIRKLLAKHIGEENVALIEKAWSIISTLIEQGPEGIFELIKDKLDPKSILDMVLGVAKNYIIEALIKQAAITIVSLFNPVGAGYQLLKLLYKVLKWIFHNAARIFRLVQTVVQGTADIVAGNIGGMAKAVEKALAGMLVTVIDFLADYFGIGDLPEKVKETIEQFQTWVEGILDRVIGFLVEQGKALLQALGLGKEEKKEDGKSDGEIGKVVNFTAAGEHHRMRIVAHGNDAEILIASDEKSVEAFLAEYTKLAEGLKGDKKTEVLGHIANARKLYEQANLSADQETALVKNASAKPAEKKAADDATEAKEDNLVEELSELISTIKRETLGEGADTEPNDILKFPGEASTNEYIVRSVKQKFDGRYGLLVTQRGRKKGELRFYYDDYGKTWEKRGEIDEQEYVRNRSPDSTATSYVAANWKECPVYGPLGGPVTADHVFALARVMTLSGYDSLALPDKLVVANLLANMMGLGKRTNSAKQDTPWRDWDGHKSDPTLPEISDELRKSMITREDQGKEAVKQEIKNRS